MACLSSILFASKSNFRLCEQGKAGDFECRLDVNFDVVNLEINYHYVLFTRIRSK